MKNQTNGGRNLVILGVVAILVALTTSGVSLAVYHASGDIYLDRSRPGYLPDDEEIEENTEKEETETEYVMEKSGVLTKEVLEEYNQNFQKEVEEVDAYGNPFAENVLLDEYLGVPAEEGAE